MSVMAQVYFSETGPVVLFYVRKALNGLVATTVSSIMRTVQIFQHLKESSDAIA